jgi:hypothetical protein
MARQLTYMVVEGPHDTALVGKLLRQEPFHLEPVPVLRNVEPFWSDLVPRTYPPKNPRTNEEEFKRVRVPEFFQNAAHSVAVQWAEGFDQIPVVLSDSLGLLPRIPDGLGLLVDADKSSASRVFSDLVARVNALLSGLPWATVPGVVAAGPPRAGVFVLPDNVNTGTLEDLLLDCATVAYPVLKPLAHQYVQLVSAAPTAIPAGEEKEFQRTAGANKAVISAMSSVLKPGKAVQNTIRDNRWLEGEALNLPRVSAFRFFLSDLMSEPSLLSAVEPSAP